MRIASFVEYFPPQLGSDRRIFEIMRRLSGRNETHFIVLPPFRILTNNLRGNEEILRRHLDPESNVKNCGITGHFAHISIQLTKLWNYTFIGAYILTTMSMLFRSVQTLKKIDPDVIVLNYPSPYTGLVGYMVARLLRRRVVLDFDDLIAEYTINLLNLEKLSFKARLLVFVQQYLVRKCELVITPTNFVRKYATALGVRPNKVTVIPNGADTEEFNPQKYVPSKIRSELGFGGERLCLYCGRLDGWAGTNLMLQVCSAAEISNLDVTFVLAGSGQITDRTQNNAVFLGEVEHEKVPALLSTASVILVPFPVNEVSHAASPLKLFEGMSMGRPVIATRLSGVEDAIEDEVNGFLVKSNEVTDWVEKIRLVLESSQESETIGKRARQTVEERFDWNLLARQYDNFLRMAYID